ncbi:hypothetical protein [Paraburkholderia sp. BL25I1N1]|uniref:hypothetical protein n=1 Tax=Paraburkholderia sp. BL25I1N1 TaxID=1938804 RepID=UPI0011B24F51|nr:hypothetical protein [Paraburkholderia sp. BL25I1N1]
MKTRGSNEECKVAMKKTIKARLTLIDRFLTGEDCDGFIPPRSVSEFRRMNIPQLNIFPIGSPSTLNVKQTPHLRDEILDVFDRLAKLNDIRHKKRITPKRPTLSEENRRLRRAVRSGKLTIAGLAKSYAEFGSQIDILKKQLKAASAERDKLRLENSELRVRIDKSPLHIVRAK